MPDTGFGVPHQRRRMLFLASMHGDARDLLLSTGMRPCTGGGPLSWAATLTTSIDHIPLV